MSAVTFFYEQLCQQQIIDRTDQKVQSLLQRAIQIEEERLKQAHVTGFSDAYGFPDKRTAEEYLEDLKGLT